MLFAAWFLKGIGMEPIESFDIKAFLEKLLRNWLIIVLCCVIGGVLAFLYSEYLVKPQYSSSVRMVLYSNDWGTKSTSVADIQSSAELVETCLTILKDDYTAKRVSEVLEDRDRTEEENEFDFSASNIRRSVSFSQVGETFIIDVKVVTGNPNEAAIICNAIAAVAPGVIQDFVPSSQVKTLGEAKVNNTPVIPNTRNNILFGILIAFVVVCLVLFLAFIIDNRITGEDDFKARFGIPVLGSIPNLDDLKKGSHNKSYGRLE